jgi:predicted MFS family arabinose efflux permease
VNKPVFSKYQIFVIALLALLQFTVVLDFIVLSPLGAQLMHVLHLTTSQFGMAVSGYAFSAGISGILAAGFADQFDRRKLLIFFYSGFILGTFLCSIAPDYHFLLMARIITGLFGGVISSISFAIITDIFNLQVRGRVLGFVQMAFATSQVMGVPVSLYFANRVGWHAPFFLITAASVIEMAVIIFFMKPVNKHLGIQKDTTAFRHLINTAVHPNYILAFGTNILLITGGYMLMPFGSAFSVNNLGIDMKDLPLLYFITGVFSMICGPVIGRLTDAVGKLKVFVYGSILSVIIILIYCNLGPSKLWFVTFLNTIMMIGILSRIISSSALMTAVPEKEQRGAFMGINSSIQQVAGGVASVIAGLIIVQKSSGALKHYNTIGYIVSATMIISMLLMRMINRYVNRKSLQEQPAELSPVPAEF